MPTIQWIHSMQTNTVHLNYNKQSLDNCLVDTWLWPFHVFAKPNVLLTIIGHTNTAMKWPPLFPLTSIPDTEIEESRGSVTFTPQLHNHWHSCCCSCHLIAEAVLPPAWSQQTQVIHQKVKASSPQELLCHIIGQAGLRLEVLADKTMESTSDCSVHYLLAWLTGGLPVGQCWTWQQKPALHLFLLTRNMLACWSTQTPLEVGSIYHTPSVMHCRSLFTRRNSETLIY